MAIRDRVAKCIDIRSDDRHAERGGFEKLNLALGATENVVGFKRSEGDIELAGELEPAAPVREWKSSHAVSKRIEPRGERQRTADPQLGLRKVRQDFQERAGRG